MGKSVDRLKKHLLEIAEAVNAFDSEAVQVKVISRVIAAFPDQDDFVVESREADYIQALPLPTVEVASVIIKTSGARKPGLTKHINVELMGNYFETARTLPEITDYLASKHESKFYTYQTSGILLGLVKRGKLKRETNPDGGGYIYLLPAE